MSVGNSCYFFHLFVLLELLSSVASLLLSIGFKTMSTSNVNGLGINFQHQHHHNSTVSNPILALLTFILPVLLVLIDFKFKNEPTSVFQAHPITIKVAVANLLAFALAFGIEFTFHPCYLSTTCAALVRTTILFCGSSQWLPWHRCCSQTHGDLSYISSTPCFHLPTCMG